jgi:hypothetical protein
LYPDLRSFGYMSRNSVTGSYGSSIFSFLRNIHAAFPSGCVNLHSHQQCVRIPVSHSHQHLFLFALEYDHGRFFTIVSFSLLVTDLFKLFVYFWFSFGES